ncbi:MAG: hypothetical protein SFZ03_03385 [Candidatus Melainabacteria bacterium]|nr:hypothetical protein [Candidatus Melainabacteria bacterium]
MHPTLIQPQPSATGPAHWADEGIQPIHLSITGLSLCYRLCPQWLDWLGESLPQGECWHYGSASLEYTDDGRWIQLAFPIPKEVSEQEVLEGIAPFKDTAIPLVARQAAVDRSTLRLITYWCAETGQLVEQFLECYLQRPLVAKTVSVEPMAAYSHPRKAPFATVRYLFAPTLAVELTKAAWMECGLPMRPQTSGKTC